jgi:hypothetical protein
MAVDGLGLTKSSIVYLRGGDYLGGGPNLDIIKIYLS